MKLILILGAPVLVLVVLGINLLIVLYGRKRLYKIGRAIFRMVNSRAETANFWIGGPQDGNPQGSFKTRLLSSLKTHLGMWGILASVSFLAILILKWVPPTMPLGFCMHFLHSWIGGIAFATLFAGIAHASGMAWQMARTQLLASRGGLHRIWLARSNRTDTRFYRALRAAFGRSQRIEIADLTGFELFAGPREEGGILSHLSSQFKDKEIRLLIFNPCSREIDPDRKQTTVIQSLLLTMEMSREAFESRIQATANLVYKLNRNRARPIQVRLYSEKPSFRLIIADEVAFMGSIDPRDDSGEFPLYEVHRNSTDASLHMAVRSHFVRAWGKSIPVQIEASTQATAVEDIAPV